MRLGGDDGFGDAALRVLKIEPVQFGWRVLWDWTLKCGRLSTRAEAALDQCQASCCSSVLGFGSAPWRSLTRSRVSHLAASVRASIPGLGSKSPLVL